MSNLTWREVSAPDFRSSMEGFTEFSKLLSSAFNGLKTGLNDFDKAASDRANSALMASIAAAQTPEAAKDIAAHVPEHFNPSRISAATWQSLMGRPGDLTKQAAAEGDLAFTTYNRDRTKEQNTNLDAARPDALRFIAAAANGDDAEASKILSESPGLQGITADQLHSLVSSGQDLTKGNLSIAGTRENQRQDKIVFGNEQTDREEGRQATALQGIIRMNGVEPADFDAYVTQNYDALIQKGISPVVIEKARHAVLSDPTSAASFYESGSLGGGGGGAVTATQMATPENASAIAEAAKQLGTTPEDLATVISYETGGKFDPNIVGGKGNNYMGLIQFGPEERAKYGVKPGMTIPQQMGAVVSFLKDRGFKPGMDIRDLYSTINAGAPGRYNASDGNGTVESHVQDMLANHRNNAVAFIARGAQDTVGVVGPQYNRSQDSGQTFARGMLQAMGSDADVRSVAAGLTGKEGVLAGENNGNVSGVIKKIAQDYHISPAAAGLILSKSVDANKNVWQRAGDRLSGIFGGGDSLTAHIDWKAVDQYGNLARNRDALLKQVAASNINDASSQLVASSSQAASAAQQQARARLVAANRLGRRIDPTGAIAQAALAEGARGDALDNSAGVTLGGGDQPAQAPKIDRRNVPQRAAPPAPARNAQNFLERKFQEMVPDKAGPAQIEGIKARFKQQYGISIDQVRSNANLAWEAAKKLDNRAAEILARQHKSPAYFRR